MERDEQPGTKTADPAEGKRGNEPGTPDAPMAQPEQPGTKTQAPAEGADDASGARGATGRAK